MRASEFRSVELLREGALTHSELGKHYGRYLGMFVDKVNNNEPFELINKDKQLELGGDQVILDASSVKLILQAYFGPLKYLMLIVLLLTVVVKLYLRLIQIK